MQQRGGQDIPGRGAEGPRRERARFVQGNEAKTAGAGAKRRGGWQKMKTLVAWAGIEPRVFPQARARGLPLRQGDKLLGHRTRADLTYCEHDLHAEPRTGSGVLRG